jgi:ribosomal-protein-alanine N-acetyltransferase
MLELVGEKIILREFSEENLYDKNYYQWLRDLAVVEGLYRIEYLKPLLFGNIERHVKNLLASENDCFFAIYCRATQKFIGTQKIGHINWRAGIGDIGLMIGDKNYWGKGLGTNVLQVALKYAFTTLSLRKLTGGTPKINAAMCRSFEKVGFMQEGVKRKELLINGKFIDHILYGLLREETTYE